MDHSHTMDHRRNYEDAIHYEFKDSTIHGGQTFNYYGWVSSNPNQCEDGFLT